MSAQTAGRRAAVVIAGGAGIGRSVALRLARDGFRVAVADIDCSAAERTASEIVASGGVALASSCDVASEADITATLDLAISTFGGLSVAVNGAGIGSDFHKISEMPLDDWNRVIQVNLTGMWLCMKYELVHMTNAGRGVIVNVASVAGFVGFDSASAYVASKHGVIGVTRSAAVEYAPRGIRINAICPGLTDTPGLRESFKGVPDYPNALQKILPGGLGDADDIAHGVAWRCSDEARYVNGLAMTMDGGWTAGIVVNVE